MVTALALAATAGAIPEQGTPEFDTYMQGLERNGFNLNPDTACDRDCLAPASLCSEPPADFAFLRSSASRNLRLFSAAAESVSGMPGA